MTFMDFARDRYGWYLGCLAGTVAALLVIAAHIADWIPELWMCAGPLLVLLGGIVGALIQRYREREARP